MAEGEEILGEGLYYPHPLPLCFNDLLCDDIFASPGTNVIFLVDFIGLWMRFKDSQKWLIWRIQKCVLVIQSTSIACLPTLVVVTPDQCIGPCVEQHSIYQLICILLLGKDFFLHHKELTTF